MIWFARLLLLLILLWVEGSWAVDCPAEDYELNGQEGYDPFGDTACDRILGSLVVTGSSDLDLIPASITSVGGGLVIQNNSGLTNLDGLANITSVGSLYVGGNPSLTDTNGLLNITGFEGGLYISGNDALLNLSGLANITSVGSIDITGNNALRNLDGLASITNTVGYLVVDGNAMLTNLDGLANITSVDGYLKIQRSNALTNLDGLANLISVGGDLIINGDALANLDGLASLSSVGGGLRIAGNDALTNVDGLTNLTSIGGELYIGDDSALSNLDGLTNLTSVGDQLHIHSNGALTNLDGLASLISIGGYLSIDYNGALTNVDGLASLSNIGGDLHIDYNNALTNVDGLANLASVPGDLIITRNSSATCEGVALLLGWPNGPPDQTVSGTFDLRDNAFGCNTVAQILASVSYPTRPVINQAITSGTTISVVFTPSVATEPFPITDYIASCTGSEVDVSGSPATDLLDNTPIQETLTVTGYDPTSVLSSIEVDIDVTHARPEHLYITLTTPQGTEVVLWNQGGAGTEDLVGTFPTTLTPVDSLDTINRQTMDGDWVLSIEDVEVGPLVREGVLNSWGVSITEELSRSGSGSPIEVLGATRGRDYSCTVVPVSKLGTTPISESYTIAVPLQLPATPSITSTDYEDGKIILTVSVTDNGGTDVTGYEATCTDGTNTYTGTSTTSPINVSGLTNDVAYTCTVTATNSVGTSSASAATVPITPEEPSTGLPIWLLYQATQ